MSQEFNPFQLWLGLDISRPTYYELLGIDPTETDHSKIEAAAKRQIATLKSVDAGDRSSQLEQLKLEIKKAFAVLTRPEKRAKYDQKLVALLTKKSNGTASVNPSTALDSDLMPPPKKSTKKPVKAHNSRTVGGADDDTADLNGLKSASEVAPVANPIANGAGQANGNEPPTAIPLAKPSSGEQETIPSAVPVARSVASPETPTAPLVESNEGVVRTADTSEPAAPNLGIRPNSKNLKRGRNSSNLVLPIVATLLGLAAIAGLVIVVNGMLGDGLANRKKDDTELKPAENGTNGIGNDDPNGEVNNDPVMGLKPNDKKPVVRPRDRNDSSKNDDGPKVDTTGQSTSNGSEPFDNVGLTNPTRSSNEPSASQLADSLFAIDDVTQLALRRRFVAVVEDWKLHRIDPGKGLGGEFQLEPRLHKKLDISLKETAKRLEEFWEQVKLSSKNFSGRDIEIDERVIGFVEGTDQHASLKIAGTLRSYEYRFLPPGIMMYVVENGAIEDVPTFRLQKAAYLISNLRQRPDLKKDIDELLRQSESDGHNVSALRLMSELKYWDWANPKRKSELVSDSEFESALRKHYSVGRIAQLRPQRAKKLAQQVILDSLDLSTGANFGLDHAPDVTDQQKRRLVMLEWARKLASRSGDVHFAMQIVDEIVIHSNVDHEKLWLDTLWESRVSAAKQLEMAKVFCDNALRYLRTANLKKRSQLVKRLGKAAEKMAEENDLRAFFIQIKNKVDAL